MNKEFYKYLFEERVAIIEWDGKIDRRKAQRIAFLEIKEILTRERFEKQSEEENYEKFKDLNSDMIFKTLYSWEIKPQ